MSGGETRRETWHDEATPESTCTRALLAPLHYLKRTTTRHNPAAPYAKSLHLQKRTARPFALSLCRTGYTSTGGTHWQSHVSCQQRRFQRKPVQGSDRSCAVNGSDTCWESTWVYSRHVTYGQTITYRQNGAIPQATCIRAHPFAEATSRQAASLRSATSLLPTTML